MSSETPHFFSADRPIARLADDRLQRSGFAKSIVQAITTWHGTDSLVVALYGGWGDGKSSVKGMVIDAMEQDEATCPFIVHFNPWEWAGQHQLAQVFFDEIGKQIAHAGNGKEKAKAKECGRRMRKLGKYLNLTGALMTPLGYAANVVFPPAIIVTEAAAKALNKSGELAKQAAEAVEDQKEREDSNLMTVKFELKKALTALNRNVVVLVDDVDRLAADEIKLLFQLIKANSDFPNLVFFLFFQRDIVERALGRTIRTGTGKDYLEKIVQVPLSLPAIQRPLLEDLVHSKLREVLVRRGLEPSFEWARFKEMWQEGLGGYFHNLRDAERFFGTFEFQVAAFPDPAEFNAVDLFALEVLRVFEPGVYQKLAAARHLVTPDSLTQFQHEGQKHDIIKSWKKSIQEIVDGGKATRPEAVNAVLRSLFPIEIFAVIRREKTDWRQKRVRVGHPAFFGRYFHLCVPEGDVRETKVLKLLQAIGKPTEFKHLLLECDEQRLALEALTRLLAYTDQFEAGNARHISAALFDEVDKLVGRYSGHYFEGLSAMACELIEAHLDKLPTVSERFTVLRSSFEATNGAYLPARLLCREQARANRNDKEYAHQGVSREQRGVFTNEQLNELARICVRNFEKAAESGWLQSHPRLEEILSWWLGWAKSPDSVKAYFRKLMATDDGLLILLEQYLGGKLSEDEHQKMVETLYDKGLSDFEQFMPVDEVKSRVEEVSRKQLSQRHANLCKVFMDLYAEHLRNKSALPPAAVPPDVQPDAVSPEPRPDESTNGEDKPKG
jgi:predicted KAP-like P-loop ATPase